jgi:polysaccharide pyruvyl transferase WcaK-like protein
MKLSIGILTYHAALNNGSMLQAYALQSALNALPSVRAEIIDFQSRGQKELYKLYRLKPSAKSIIKDAMTTMHLGSFKRYRAGFNEFRQEYLIEGPGHAETSDQVKSLSDRYDIIVTGSDQIWNQGCPDFDSVYFCKNIQNKKLVAYAPSFGGISPFRKMDTIEKIKNLLTQYSYLSAREPNGQEWMKQLGQTDVTVVPDPTLLHEKKFWLELATTSIKSNDYIFFYGVSPTSDTYRRLRQLSDRFGMPIVMMDPTIFFFRQNNFRGFKLSESDGPIGFLRLIAEASYVLTSSFHGTVFATLFEKKFVSLNYATSNSDDDRVLSLLKQLGQTKRYVEARNINKLEDKDFKGGPVDAELAILRENGNEFLRRAIL